MSPRLPLSVKILLWFFLNLALLTGVSLVLFNAEYHFNLDWLFSGNARLRVDTMRNLLVDDLNNTAPEDWDNVLDRYRDAYRVQMSLFEDDGRRLLGSTAELPREVRSQLPLRSRNATGETSRALVHTQNPDRYWLAVPARVDNPQIGAPMRVQIVAEANSPTMGGLVIDVRPWLWLAAGGIVFSSLLWLPLLRGITRSIRQVTDAARAVAEGRFDVRVPGGRRDELGTLSEAINQMAARLDGLMRGQKRFLGDVAHELCSPLARLQLALGIIEQRAASADGENGEDPRQAAYLRTAVEKAGQIARLVDQLLAFSRASIGGEAAVRLRAVDLRAAAGEALAREDTEGADVRLEIPAGIPVRADPELIGRALGNLLRNAVRHGGTDGPIVICARAHETEPAVWLAVSDCGPGVPTEDLPRIFDAFYRVDTARARATGGVGLGLSIVKICVEACGGSVRARNREPHGLEVVVRLAAAAGESDPPETPGQ